MLYLPTSCYNRYMTSSKYMQIVEELRRDLHTSRPGERFLSEHQVTMRFDVSRPTASRALTELCRDGLVERRVGSGTFVSDNPSADPRERLRSVGLLLSGLGSTEVWDPLAAQVNRVCSSLGLSLRMGPPSPPQDDVLFTRDQALDLIGQEINGVIFAPLENVPDRERENRRICKMFTAARIPVVLIDRDIVNFPERSEFDVVGVDNVRGGAQLAEHLVSRGYRSPVYFSRPQHPSTTDQRVAGCAVTFLARGVHVPAGWHVEADPGDGELVARLMTDRSPDVVIAANDHTAARLIQTLARLGYSVPEDVAVTGFDDTPYSALLSVPLTTVRQSFEAIARAAVRTLFERIGEPEAAAREILLPPQLVVRESTGGAGHGAASA